MANMKSHLKAADMASTNPVSSNPVSSLHKANTSSGTVSNPNDIEEMQKKMTLLFHAVRFPDPALSNKPDYFGLGPEYNKRFMSLGRMKLLPKEVLVDTFGAVQKAPLHKLQIIRSRLQAFVDQYTFGFMNGLARAIPNEKLGEFTKLVKDLNKEFDAASASYISHREILVSKSQKFWQQKALDLDIPYEELLNEIRKKIINIHNNDFHFEVSHFAITTPKENSGHNLQGLTHEEILVIEARQEVVKESVKELQYSMAEFKEKVLLSLRLKYQEAFSELLKSLESGKFNQKSINSVLKMCDEFKSLNIMEDETLEQYVEGWKTKLKLESAKKIKTDATINKEFSAFLAGEIKKLEEIKDEAEDFGETIAREVDPF